MERLAQYWDDLDDLVGAVGLLAERLRRLVLFALNALIYLLLVSAGIQLAFLDPPLAAAVATILAILLLYRSVTQPRFGARPA